jgi:His-Xaa-Ser system protein HxsD
MAPAETTAVQQNDDGSCSVLFDLSIHSQTAIKKAVYKFAGDCSAILTIKGPNGIEARLAFPDCATVPTKKAIVEALCNEVIDQDLREQIARETEATRNLILAQAFSKTSLLTEG